MAATGAAGGPVRIGVLSVQGAFAEHVALLRSLGADAVEVRLPEDLAGVRGLVLPGGESTAMRRLIARWELREPLLALLRSGVPVLGTCAGMILLAREIEGGDEPVLPLLDVTVRRNAFGRQLESFETDLSVPVLGDPPVHAVFIRAPVIARTGPEVEVLARLPDGRIVAVRQGRLLATAFHPELAGEPRFHRILLALAAEIPPDAGSGPR